MAKVSAYVDAEGRCPFARWFDGLDSVAAAKVTIATTRMKLGDWSNVKGVGAGVFERRIEFGPGYRIYFGKKGEDLIILLGGGTKVRQQDDVKAARLRWREYKSWKRKGS